MSFRTIRYSRKDQMKHQSIEFYPNRRSKMTLYKNRLGGESFLEDSLMVLQEHSPSITQYLPQSVPISKNQQVKKWEYKRRDGIFEEWTPDSSCLWKNRRPLVIEVKSVGWIQSLVVEDKKKLFHKWDQAKQYANDNNYDFLVFTDAFKDYSWRVENLRDLESQMRFSKKEIEDVLIQLIQKNPEEIWTVKKLQNHSSIIDIPKFEISRAVCSLIYGQTLFIDLEEEFKFETTFLKSSPDKQEIPFYEWLLKYQYNWEEINLEEIAKVDFGIINRSDLTKYQLLENQKNRDIIKAIKEGIHYKHIIEDYNISYGKYQTLKTLLTKFIMNSITEYEFDIALIPKKPTGRAKKKLFTVNYNGKANFSDIHFGQAIDICLEKQNRVNLTDSWNFYKTLKRQDAFEQGLTPRTNETLSVLIAIATRTSSFNHETYNIFRSELQRYKKIFYKRVIAKREGMKRANKETMIVTGSTPYTNYIGQMVQMDHTPADIINTVAIPVSIMVENEKISKCKKTKRYYMERPVITILEDIHTGVILGYMLRYRKPSIETDFQAIRRMIIGNINPLLNESEENNRSSTITKIMRGINELAALGIISKKDLDSIQKEFAPKSDNLREIANWWDNIRVFPYLLHMDNGSDFTSEQMKKWMAKNRVNTGYRPVGGSQYGGHVERLLGTLNRSAFHNMTGTTKNSKIERKDYPSEKMAILTFEQIEALLLLAMIRYHAHPKSEDQVSPYEKWRQSYDKNGHNIHFLPSGKISNLTPKMKQQIRQLAWDLLPNKMASYNQKAGITLNNLRYNDEIWRKFLSNKQKVNIRYSRSDIRFVWWWYPQEDRPIQIWAKKIKLGDRIYNNNQLQRMPPISDLQHRDLKQFQFWLMGMDLAEKYERMVNSADNVYYSIYKNIPKSVKDLGKIDQKMVRKIDEGRIEAKEVAETNTFLVGGAKEIKTKWNQKSKKKTLNRKKKTQSAWNQPIEVKIIKIPPTDSNPFSNKIINLKIKPREEKRREDNEERM